LAKGHIVVLSPLAELLLFDELWLWLAMINLPTKFEISISVRYEDMKGDTTCGIHVRWAGTFASGGRRSMRIALMNA